jgi:hypothetical protein
MLKDFHAMAYTSSFMRMVRILEVMVAAAATSQILLRQFPDNLE